MTSRTMQVTYGAGFFPAVDSRAKVERLQAEISKLPQYEMQTEHYFHGGMYCRKGMFDAGVLMVGKVHKTEHFFLVVSGRVLIEKTEYGPGELILSKPGTKRAIYSLEPSVCMNFHKTDATTVEAAELELVEVDESAMFTVGNILKPQLIEVTPCL